MNTCFLCNEPENEDQPLNNYPDGEAHESCYTAWEREQDEGVAREEQERPIFDRYGIGLF